MIDSVSESNVSVVWEVNLERADKIMAVFRLPIDSFILVCIVYDKQCPTHTHLLWVILYEFQHGSF